ncbi:MAG: response regulator transcription factor [Oscillatoriales cyanobacterium RM1_1_9]|nr:response regulator transcription factor [Oscillatoriales cyanobacterium SM2_3_0]NJO46969.1 response regulator transcription factor [Oscillatoriales cyanobacterium RM2_1_1]NJO71851.1 response regulator transcription factor [Oscillatoriales cyanobacterium RM1_1_9]
MESGCIAIVEGNPHLRSLLGWHLQQTGYCVYQSADFHQARDVFYGYQPDLFILDGELPGGNSLEFCKWLESQGQSLVLILSTHKSEADIVRSLKAGADDYLTKPFGMHEFLARVEALMRRSRTVSPPSNLDYGILKIDLVQRRVKLRGAVIELTPQEYSLLYVLAQAEGEPLSRSELLQRAWPDSIDNPRTIDTHVLSLRKKIEPEPRQPNLIQTVRNVGYRLNLEILKLEPRSPKLNSQVSPMPVQAIS